MIGCLLGLLVIVLWTAILFVGVYLVERKLNKGYEE